MINTTYLGLYNLNKYNFQPIHFKKIKLTYSNQF